MKITQVEYRRLRSFGVYQNETVGAVAQLGEWEFADDALKALREWVDGELDKRGEVEDLDRQIAAKREACRQAERDLEQTLRWRDDAMKSYTALRDKLAEFGVTLPTTAGC